MNRKEFEECAELITDLMNDDKRVIATEDIEDKIVDFVLRCIKGIFKGKFIYLNLTPEGETFGSDPNADLTMYIENAGLSEKHAEIKYNPSTKKYILRDLNSKTGVWIRVRPDSPVLITDEMVFRVGNEKFTLKFANDPKFDCINEWLKKHDLLKLAEYLKQKEVKKVEEIKLFLTEDDINKLDLVEVESNIFITGIADIDLDFNEKTQTVVKDKLLLEGEAKEGAALLEISWAGAIMGNLPNADLVFQNFINDNEEGRTNETEVEIGVKFQYGNYWFITTKNNQAEVYYRLKENEQYNLIPDDIINMGDLDFLVQRFNTGFSEDKGTRNSMEDISIVRQELGISYRLNVSFYAVYDGHGGNECAKFVGEHLVENLRNVILKGDNFDKQSNFYRYVHDSLTKVMTELDMNFYNEYSNFSLTTGCAAIILLIVGDILICANLGDSRAILSRNGKPICLSMDHKPHFATERKRIEMAGGEVMMGRISGRLAVSRAFGDFEYKPLSRNLAGKAIADFVIATPEIRTLKIDYLQDEFIFMACDGLYDVFSSEKCVTYIREKLAEMPLMEQDPQLIVKDLVEQAVHESKKKTKKSDNISVILLTLTGGVHIASTGNVIKKKMN